MDAIWGKFRQHVHGEILFGIPARAALFVEDSAVPEAVAQLAKTTAEFFAKWTYRISPAIYMLKDGAAAPFEPGQQSIST